jgi:hypothetical protein
MLVNSPRVPPDVYKENLLPPSASHQRQLHWVRSVKGMSVHTDLQAYITSPVLLNKSFRMTTKQILHQAEDLDQDTLQWQAKVAQLKAYQLQLLETHKTEIEKVQSLSRLRLLQKSSKQDRFTHSQPKNTRLSSHPNLIRQLELQISDTAKESRAVRAQIARLEGTPTHATAIEALALQQALLDEINRINDLIQTKQREKDEISRQKELILREKIQKTEEKSRRMTKKKKKIQKEINEAFLVAQTQADEIAHLRFHVQETREQNSGYQKRLEEIQKEVDGLRSRLNQ